MVFMCVYNIAGVIYLVKCAIRLHQQIVQFSFMKHSNHDIELTIGDNDNEMD